jgi:integrase
VAILASIERQDRSAWTKHDYKLALRKYLAISGREDLASLVKLPKVNNYKLPEELISRADILELLDTQGRIEDHAIIFVLWESGCRIGEVLSLQRKHVVMDAQGAIIIVDGKTGMRRVRLMESAAVLDDWISCRSLKSDGYIFPNTYRAYAKRLQTLARRAGIDKRVYPHLFRHSRATFLAGYLTEAQLCAYLGWTIGSAMPRIYVHLAGHDLDAALSKIPPLFQPRPIELKN